MPGPKCVYCRETIPADVDAIYRGTDEKGPIVFCGPCMLSKLRVIAVSCLECGRELSAASWNMCPPYCSVSCWREGRIMARRERPAVLSINHQPSFRNYGSGLGMKSRSREIQRRPCRAVCDLMFSADCLVRALCDPSVPKAQLIEARRFSAG